MQTTDLYANATLAIKAYDDALGVLSEVIHDQPHLVNGEEQPWDSTLLVLQSFVQAPKVTGMRVVMALESRDDVLDWVATQLAKAELA